MVWPVGQPLPKELNDSKQMTPLQRERCFVLIQQGAVAVGVGRAEAAEVDELGVGRATHLAMKRAIAGIGTGIDMILVDGWRLEFEVAPSIGVIDGDCYCVSIAAASVVAKVTRDRWLVEMEVAHPGFGFAQHKGYGTKLHQEMIARSGICFEHRRSFAPIRQHLIEAGV